MASYKQLHRGAVRDAWCVQIERQTGRKHTGTYFILTASTTTTVYCLERQWTHFYEDERQEKIAKVSLLTYIDNIWVNHMWRVQFCSSLAYPASHFTRCPMLSRFLQFCEVNKPYIDFTMLDVVLCVASILLNRLRCTLLSRSVSQTTNKRVCWHNNKIKPNQKKQLKR